MEMQNSRKNSKLKGENPQTQGENSRFGKFYSNNVENNKVNVKLSLCLLNSMYVIKNGFFLKVQFFNGFSQTLMKKTLKN